VMHELVVVFCILWPKLTYATSQIAPTQTCSCSWSLCHVICLHCLHYLG
jgi:hypothetical protein